MAVKNWFILTEESEAGERDLAFHAVSLMVRSMEASIMLSGWPKSRSVPNDDDDDLSSDEI